MSPIHTGWAEMPISTNTIAARSISERGRSAERTPTGMAISIQKTTPPNTREAVTGAALPTIELTSWRLANDVPSDAWKINFSKNFQYWT